MGDVMHPGAAPGNTGGTVGPRDTLRHAANVLAESDGLPLEVLGADGALVGHLLLVDLLIARKHDLSEDRDRDRLLTPFPPALRRD